AERIVLALVAAEEAGDAAFLPEGAEAVAPAGQQLVGVGLVPDVPDELVLRGGEDMVQGDGELDRAEAGSEMPAGARDGIDQRDADFGGKLRQVPGAESLEVVRGVDAGEDLPLREIAGLGGVWRNLAIAGGHRASPSGETESRRGCAAPRTNSGLVL